MEFTAEKASTTGEMDQPSNAPAARILAWMDRHRWKLLIAILVLYAAGFTGRWRPNPDSAIYMSLGRSLAETGQYLHNGEHHTRYEPGLPVVIAASYRLFGEDRYAPILLFELACSLTALGLCYLLISRHAGRPTAVLITAGFGICETAMRYGFQVVTDTPFLVGVLAYLLAYEHIVAPPRDGGPKRPWVRGLAWATLPLATFFMVTMRPTALTFVAAVGLACVWHLWRGPHRARHVIIGVLTLAAFLSFRTVDPRRTSAGAEVKREQRLKALLTEQRSYFIPRIAREAYAFVDDILPTAIFATPLGPGIGVAVSLAIMASVVPLLRRRLLWGVWCLGTFAQCMIWLPRERYLLPIMPLILYGVWLQLSWLSRRPRLSPAGSMAVLVVPMAVFALPNLALDIHLLIQQRHVGVDRTRALDGNDAARIEMAKQIAGVVDEDDDETLVFATDHDELSYFSRRRIDGTPWSGRWPPTKADLEAAFKRTTAAPRVYVVLPDGKDADVRQFIEKLGMRPGPALVTVPRPLDRKGKPVEPLSLHLLEPVPAPTVEGR